MFSKLEKNNSIRPIVAIVFLFFVATILISPKRTNFVKADTIPDSNFNIGKVYSAGFGMYFPSGETLKDANGLDNDPLKPTCAAQIGIPYGTKIRIFGTETDFDGKICVVNRNILLNPNQNNNAIMLDFITPDQSAVTAWGQKTGRAIIVSLGDGVTLDFSDNGEYKTDDPTVTGPMNGSAATPGEVDDEQREEFFISNRIYYYKPECFELREEDDMIGPDSTIEERAERALTFLTEDGFTLNQAAGIVANLWAESKIMPACQEGGGNDCCYQNFYNDRYVDKFNCNGGANFDPFNMEKSRGFGIMQFTGSGETEVVKKVAEVREKDPLSMSVQLEAMMISLFANKIGCFTGPPQRINKNPNIGLGKVDDPIEACFTFVDCYGIPRSANCGFGHLKKGRAWKKCWNDVVDKLGATCVEITKEEGCEYSSGFVGYSQDKGKCCLVTQEVAQAVYNNTYNNRCFRAKRLVEQFSGTISDGEGVDVDYLTQVSKDFLNDIDDTGFEEEAIAASQKMVPCEKTNTNLSGIQNLVSKSAWPIYCKPKEKRTLGDGRSCDAQRGTDFYNNLITCRQGDGGNSCSVVGGTPRGGVIKGRDCAHFVKAMVQESGLDPSYSGVSGSGWTKIFEIGEVDTSKLLPGDVGVYRIPNFHTVLFVGNIPEFEFPVASASYSEDPLGGRYPSASKAMSEADRYAWYRKPGGGE